MLVTKYNLHLIYHINDFDSLKTKILFSFSKWLCSIMYVFIRLSCDNKCCVINLFLMYYFKLMMDMKAWHLIVTRYMIRYKEFCYT